MRTTVPWPVSAKPIDEGGERTYINQELLKILPQLRTFANMLGWEAKTLTSDASGTYQTIWTSGDMGTAATWLLMAYVSAALVDNTSNLDHYGAAIMAVYAADTGSGIYQIGSTTTLIQARTSANMAVQFITNYPPNRTVSLQVRDRAGGTDPMNWKAVVLTCEAMTV